MGSYAKVAHSTWGDAKFRRLSPMQASGQALWLFLISGPHNRGVPGLFALSRGDILDRLGWSREEFDSAFGELEHQHMAFADWDARLVWLPNAMKYDPPANPSVIAGWWRQISPLPESDLLATALTGMYERCADRGTEYGDAFVESVARALSASFAERIRKKTPCATPSLACAREEQGQGEVPEQVLGMARGESPREGGELPTEPIAPTEAPKALASAGPKPEAVPPKRQVRARNGLPAVLDPEVVRIFDHWRFVCGHEGAQLDAYRYGLISARKDDGYAVEQLELAVDGCKRSAWHQGANERRQIFDGPDLIFRDATHVDRFIAIALRGDVVEFRPLTAVPVPSKNMAALAEARRRRDGLSASAHTMSTSDDRATLLIECGGG